MQTKLWNRNFTLLIAATGLGAIGGIAGGFAMSFLVFDETGSTMASALVLAAQLIPGFLLPLVIAPWMDRMPRKPFLVGGDVLNGIMYLLLGLYLLRGAFSYVGYLAFSLVLATLSSFDELAYNSIFPMLLPEGTQQKGYAVASTLYPVLRRLQKDQLLTVYDAPFNGRNRRYYQITTAGRQQLAAYAQEWSRYRSSIDTFFREVE